MSRRFSQNVSLSNHSENNNLLKSIPLLNTFRVTADSHIAVFAYSLWSSPLIFLKHFGNISVTQSVVTSPVLFFQFGGYLGAWKRLGLNQAEIMSLLERKQKNSPNAFRIRIFLFRSYSFGNETINTSIHVRSSSYLENHTRFCRFQTKMAASKKPEYTLSVDQPMAIWSGFVNYSVIYSSSRGGAWRSPVCFVAVSL